MKIKFKQNKPIENFELSKLKSQYKSLSEQVPLAKLDMEIAESFFNNAEPRYIDVAILTKEAAVQRYTVLIKELKELRSQIESFDEIKEAV